MGSVDIVIRSHAKDFAWLRHCLAGVRRWCTGFRDVVVVVPRRCEHRLARYGIEADRIVLCSDHADDYLGQQVTKTLADTFTDADFIAHLDSDCVVRRPLTPADLVDDAGRPRLLYTPGEHFRRGAPWQAATERFLGRPVTCDYMRRQPLVYPRWIYPELREHAVRRHGVELAEYIMAQPPLGFSEFNAMGAYAHERHRDAFAWTVHPSSTYDETWTRVFWSWSGITPAVEHELRVLGRAAARTEDKDAFADP
ncbi:hypothetical protein [Streptomyces sp. NPDC094149]|uniref:hypothetical protein n=1 Tax=Streptomyces sp. NPDC094149 TaxID=3155079 RepID=UPI00332348CC